MYAGLRLQKPGREQRLDEALYSSSMMLRAPRFGLPGHIGAVDEQRGDQRTQHQGFYTEIGDREVDGQRDGHVAGR